MRYTARLFALILALMPVLAFAQSAPANLPAQSVYGRLGIPGDTGPGQAIPFTTLGFKLSAALSGGVAKMFPHLGQTISASDCYTLIDPYGNAITCTTATTTQGLQEFLNATAANGWPAEVACQGTQFPSGTEPIYIQANTSVTVPVAQDWSFHSYGCNLNFNVTTVSGLIIDSQGASVFDWDGKIVYNVTAPNGNVSINPSCAVLIQPTTHTQDGFAGLYAGYLRIKSPVNNPTGGSISTGVICINASGGSVIQQRLDFAEVNANNNAYYGIFAFGATPTTGLQQTEINAQQIHGALTAGANIGYSGANQANYNSNQWKINNIENASTSSRGIDTFGSSDTFDIGVINAVQGGLGTGIVTESGSTYNKFRYGSITGWTTLDWLDSGSCNEFSGGSGTSGGANGTRIVAVGGTSGCTKIVPSAVASGTLTLPNASGTFAVGASSPIALSLTTGMLTLQGATGTVAAGTGGTGSTFTPTPTLGTAGSTVGSLAFANATSGSVTLQPATGALGAAVLTMPSATDTLVARATTETLTNKTIAGATLSGTISGGGNQVNNVVVGAITPLAGTFTNLQAQAGNSTSNIRVTGQIAAQVSATGNGADTTEDTLQTFSLPANTLDAVGRGVRVKAWGTFAANADTKTVRAYFGAAAYNSTGLTSSGVGWYVWLDVFKTGANTQTAVGTGIYANTIPATNVNALTQTDSGAIIIKITGQAGTANANDIICQGMTVEMIN